MTQLVDFTAAKILYSKYCNETTQKCVISNADCINSFLHYDGCKSKEFSQERSKLANVI